MLVAISTLASSQMKDTHATLEATIKLLSYYDTHLDAKKRYHASDMILKISSNAFFISEAESRG
jgi:hypothetical protein